MKSIVISIRPKWVARILNNEKTIEIRKSKPKEQVEWVYIYCTKPDIRSRYRIGRLGFSNDEVYKLPNGSIEYGDSVELMAYDDFDHNNFFNGKIVARFKIGNIDKIQTALAYNENIDEIEKNSNLTLTDIMRYAEGKNVYGWHIQKLEIFDKLKELSEFGLKKAPQSWCYVKGGKNGNR